MAAGVGNLIVWRKEVRACLCVYGFVLFASFLLYFMKTLTVRKDDRETERDTRTEIETEKERENDE